MSTGEKVAITLMCILGMVLFLGAASLVPLLSLGGDSMKSLRGTYVTVYYETEEAAARDVFALAEAESGRIAQKLGLVEPPPVNCYIYDKQSTFQTKKYGSAALLLGLEWYVGDNRGMNVLLTSPANPGRVHTYEDVRATSLHEIVHAYNSLINPHMRLWINEGVALYLTNGSTEHYVYRKDRLPTPARMRSGNPLMFSQAGGYTFACLYIEYLDKMYGWDRVLVLMRTGDYVDTFGVGEQEIYDGWMEFLWVNYRPSASVE